MISAVVRLRLKPWRAVAQNAQSSGQPTCEDTHKVPRSPSGMNTVSMELPLPTRISHLRVPSLDSCSDNDGGRTDLAVFFQVLAQRAAEIGHRVEIDDAELVHPLDYLRGAKSALTDALEVAGQTGGIEVEQIGERGGRHDISYARRSRCP
jgi:hypothetical protein